MKITPKLEVNFLYSGAQHSTVLVSSLLILLARVTHFLGLPIIPFRSFLLCRMKIDFLFVFLNVSQRIRALIHLNHSVRTLPSDNSEHAVKYIFIVLFSFLELRTCLLYSNIIRTLPALPFYLLLVRV